MTQAVSTDKSVKKKASPCLHNGQFFVKNNLKMLIMNFIFHFLAFPLIIIMLMVNISVYGDEGDIEMYVVIAVLTTIAGVITGAVTAMQSFKSMYNKQYVDMEFSLPMTSLQRFLSNYLSGLFVYIMPFLAAQLFSLILLGIGCGFFDGKTFIPSNHVFSDPTVDVSQYAWVCDAFGQLFNIAKFLIPGGLMIMLMFYTMWVFTTVCCGSTFEAIAYSTGINALIPGVLGVIFITFFESAYGMDFSDTFVKIIGCTSPGGAVFGLVMAIEDCIDNNMAFSMLPFMKWLAPTLLITAAIFGGAAYLYTRRKAEQTGSPFAFKAFYHVVAAAITYCISSLFYYSDSTYDYSGSNFVPMIIISAVVYLILDVIANRGVKKIWKGIVRYAVTLGAVSALYLIVSGTELLGAVYKVPSSATVASVKLEYEGYFGDNNYDTSFESLTIKDKDNIQCIINAHKKELDYYKEIKNGYREYNGDYAVTDDVRIEYQLIGGGTLVREYSLRAGARKELMSIDISDEYKAQYIEYFTKEITDRIVNFEQNLTEYRKTNRTDDYYREAFSLRFINMSRLKKDNYYLELFDGTEEFGNELIRCLTEDVNAMTYDDYYKSDIPEAGYLRLPDIFTERGYWDSGDEIIILGCYKNTIDLLQRYDIDITDNSEGITAYTDISMSYSDHERLMSGTHNTQPKYLNNYEYETDMDTLLENCVYRYIPDGSYYTINVNGSGSAYIPTEYNHIAAKLYDVMSALGHYSY
ncbi:MAG: hypothetical protein IJ446_02680 [Oscillospiraceae bacterium]|nr:hypothetical protein [Oscillospiraceae bacterium]